MMRRLLFWLLWPAVWMYAPLTRRVRVVLFRQEGEVLLVKNSFGPGLWQLPGGGIKFGESIETAATREVQEELGMSIGSIKILNAEPVICKQFGLLMRYNYVLGEIRGGETVRLGSGILTYTWTAASSKTGLSTEVVQGLELAARA